MKMIPKMTMPGITKDEMMFVDKLMIENGISLELMMENAGLNLARLVYKYHEGNKINDPILVVAGSGGNGGGGIVAARRLAAWGNSVEVYIPKGSSRLQSVPFNQMKRAKKVGVTFNEGVPNKDKNYSLILDSYIGYSYEKRQDNITDQIFSYFQEKKNIISLDCPSGMNVTTGEIASSFSPEATLTLAFVKSGLLLTDPAHIGELYVADIGVPIEIFLSKIGIHWISPYNTVELHKLYSSFAKHSFLKIKRIEYNGLEKVGWKI
jgi:NAD(P)H-hydrate epimerase